MEKIQKLTYCQNKNSNSGHCANIACYKVKLRNRKNDSVNAQTADSFRCEEHKGTGTNGKKVIEILPFDQSEKIQIVNKFLDSLIGKTIQATCHTAKELQVKYRKENGAVMCFQPHSKKWKYVYSYQVIIPYC